MTTLREADEPVAWIWTFYDIANDRYVRRIIDCEARPNIPGYDLIPLYITPPQRKPLTDGEIMDLCAKQWASHPIEVARVIEAAHGIGSEV
jgi:hypothetical protein